MPDSLAINQATTYINCKIVAALSGSVMLYMPISKICPYFDDSLAIFYGDADFYSIVDSRTMAVKDIKQLPTSPSTAKLTVTDAVCNASTKAGYGRHLHYAYRHPVTGKAVVGNTAGKSVAGVAKSCFIVWNDDVKMFDKMAGVVRRVMSLCHDGSLTILTDEGLAHYAADPSKPFDPRR